MYKYALAMPAIPYLSNSVANIIKSIFGKNKKAFALDADNTLWGGIIGDDGVENIQIGSETPIGRAYSEFQEYMKSHKQLGVLLNIISKNEEENVLSGLSRPDSILHANDFISIKANWEPKSDNLQDLSNELMLLPESFVFVDDNPAEREIINQTFHDVPTPNLLKPEQYITAINLAGYFEVTNLTNDDAKRVEQYKENAARTKSQSMYTDYKEYLSSLNMVADIKPFEPMYMSRIAQLTNKSNQFNLTTLRCTQDEIKAFADHSSYITLYGKLKDKFGDNGVVSAVIAEIEEEESLNAKLHIRLWLMSCRVLKRDFEYAMMDELVRISKERNIKEIYGYYYPTAKNSIVKDFYDKQGFTKLSDETWCFDLSKEYTNKQTIIKVN
jgi:FkbH-like protein